VALFVAVVATICVVVSASLSVHGASSLVDGELEQQVRFAEQTARVRYYDEVLTSSALLHATTGDARWRTRYDAHVGPLDEAIANIREMAPVLFDAALGAETDAANQKLIAMEERAMALADAGQRDLAVATLLSPAYAEQKARYAAGNEAAHAVVRAAIDDRARDQRAAVARTLIIGNIAGVAMGLAWIAVIRAIRRYVAVQQEGVRAEAEAEAARRASDAKSLFLANMSHEIRTPMTAILGFADLLADDAIDDPGQSRHAVRTIQSNARHLLAIVNDVLDVSKIEAGQLTVEWITTSPALIVEEVASMVRAAADERGLEVHVQYQTPIPRRIESDPTRLRQILVNLAGNAVKFTERGSITIQVAHLPTADTMRFRIVDTGVGMTADELARVRRFGLFAQADETITRRYGGTGLGLHIARSLAGMLGGSLEIDAIAGEGTTCTLTIASGEVEPGALMEPDAVPSLAGLREMHAETAVPDAPVAAPRPLEGIRVLMAEDGPDNQRLISFHLRRAGAAVTICENGLEAVETVHASPPDEQPHLILMDMQMPVLDGYEATRRLRAADVAIPVIALTAHAMDGDRRRCLDAGCVDYACKPIDREALLAICLRWARRDERRRAA
jgi:signal transduction histidine kinase/ActR/RegA family two-component response regulator